MLQKLAYTTGLLVIMLGAAKRMRRITIMKM